MRKIPFLWTNDDITYGQYDQLARQLDFLAKYEIKGTFFVIPIPAAKHRLTDDPKLVELLRDAMADGHEAHQHTVTHQCIENGIADIRMFDLMGEHRKIDFSQNRFLYERLWQTDAIEAHIEWGRKEWIDAFGEPSAGYRPGCGAFCGNMYRALANLGFKWCSCQMVSMTGWRWSAGMDDYPMALDRSPLPYRLGDLVELPMLDDPAFRVSREKIDALADLGGQLWDACREQNAPFTLVSHPFGLEHEGGTGYAIHDQLLTRILASGDAQPMTLNVYYDQLQTGDWPMGQPVHLTASSQTLPDWHALAQPQTTDPTKA